jgi:hypothetical protein
MHRHQKHFAGSGPAFDRGMSLLDHLDTDMAGIEARHDLACLYQPAGLAKNFSVMRVPFPGQQRQQRG